FWKHPVSSTFHGRDVLSPVAAHLSLGARPEELRPPVERWVELALPAPALEARRLAGEGVYGDDFGDLLTNIPAAPFRAPAARPRPSSPWPPGRGASRWAAARWTGWCGPTARLSRVPPSPWSPAPTSSRWPSTAAGPPRCCGPPPARPSRSRPGPRAEHTGHGPARPAPAISPSRLDRMGGVLYNGGGATRRPRPTPAPPRQTGDDSMETVNFTCGHCGKLLAVSKQHLGQQVRCPHCQQGGVAPPPQPGPPPP